MENDNSIINAVKRLERAGSEHSRATQKLQEAAKVTLDWLLNTLPPEFSLPDPKGELHEMWKSQCLDLEPGEEDISITWRTPLLRKAYHEAENTDLYDGYELRISGVIGEWRGGRACDIERSWALALAREVAGGLIVRCLAVVETDQTEIANATKTLTEAV